MTTRVTTLPCAVVTVAAYQAFCQMWHDNFAAAGMAQTLDTGQVNIPSIAAKPGTSLTPHYEIWRFTDYWASAAPLYMKVEYGIGAGVSVPQMRISFGTGSNGGGVLTYDLWPGASNATTPRLMNFNHSSAATASVLSGPIYFTYLPDGSWAFLAWPNDQSDNTGTWFFAVERFRNPDGSASPDGVSTFYGGVAYALSGVFQDGRLYLPGVKQSDSPLDNWLVVPGDTTLSPGTLVGTMLYPLPAFTGMQPRVASPSQLVVVLGARDMPADAKFSMAHYGVNRQWICAGPGDGSNNNGFGKLDGATFVYSSFAMRMDPP